MKNNTWKLAAAVGAAALIIALVAAAIIALHKPASYSELPEPDAPDVAAPVATPAPTPEVTPVPTAKPAPELVTFIGDSIMVAAEPELTKLLPECVVDAKVGRQLVEAPDIIRRLKNEGKLYDTVVIGLGSNLPFTVEEGSEVLDMLGDDRTIYWVTCYGRYLDWQDDVNETIAELDEMYDNLTVIDWSAVAPEQPGWIRSDDGIHLTADGMVGYAEFVAAAIGVDVAAVRAEEAEAAEEEATA